MAVWFDYRCYCWAGWLQNDGVFQRLQFFIGYKYICVSNETNTLQGTNLCWNLTVVLKFLSSNLCVRQQILRDVKTAVFIWNSHFMFCSKVSQHDSKEEATPFPLSQVHLEGFVHTHWGERNFSVAQGKTSSFSKWSREFACGQNKPRVKRRHNKGNFPRAPGRAV